MKISIIALLLTGAVQLAKAQVSVGIGVHIGTPIHRVYYEPAPAPVYYDPAPAYCPPPPPAYCPPPPPASVYYERPVVVRRYYRPAYYAPRFYRRPVVTQVVYRERFYHDRGHHYGRRW
ncbi:hypothetical protein CKK33_15830 [Mucilaginibacter sp. MD40]|nr:hypothetical protein CKK33_15830 [Mucilaginibacter sp. MD40]